MLKFLLDGNLSWETKEFLVKLGYRTDSLVQFGLSRSRDSEIIQFARKHQYIVISLDLDFGEIYYFASQPAVGVIVLKLKNQTIESVNKALKILLDSKILNKKSLQKSLIIFDGKKIRVRRK